MSGVVTVGAAVAAIGVAAVEMTPFAVIAAVGATAGAVGYFTKSKELQIAGTALGVVGAVGGLASAAGAFGEGGIFGSGGGAGIVGQSAEGAMTAANMAMGLPEASGAVGLTEMSGVAGPSGMFSNLYYNNGGGPQSIESLIGKNMLDHVAEMADSPEIAAATSPGIVKNAQPANVAGGKEPFYTSAENTPVTQVAAPAEPAAPAASPVSGKVTLGPGMDASGPANGIPDVAKVPGRPDQVADLINKNILPESKVASDSVWKDILSFAKDNKFLVGGAVQGAFSFLSGATDPRTPATITAMESQAAANRAAAARSNAETGILNQRLANMRGPVPVASRITGQPYGVGLINSPTVTGQPA